MLTDAGRDQLIWSLHFHWQRKGFVLKVGRYSTLGRRPVRKAAITC